MLSSIGKQTDNEAIKQAKDKIDEAEERIEAFKAKCIKNESFYKLQIERTKAEIKSLKDENQRKLQEIKKTHENELNEFEEKEKKEINEIKNRIEEHSQGNNGFKNHKNGLQQAMKQAELSDLKHQLELAKLRKAEKDLEKRTKIKSINTESHDEIQELNMKIEELNAEIGEIKSSSKTNQMQAVSKKREAELKYQARCEENAKKLKEIQIKYSEKQAQNKTFIKQLQDSGNRKIAQYQKELNDANEQLKILQELQEKLRRKFSNQIQSMKEEIENAKEAVKIHTERLRQQQEEVIEREHKVNEILKENVILDETIKSLNEDIAKTKRGNQTLKRESTRLESQIYTDRIGSVRNSSYF